jgi:hypothetical protein
MQALAIGNFRHIEGFMRVLNASEIGLLNLTH